MKDYKVRLLYYTSRDVIVRAESEEEAERIAMTYGIDDETAKQAIVDNAILEGAEIQ